MRRQTTSGYPYLAHYHANQSQPYGMLPYGQSNPIFHHYAHSYPYQSYQSLNAENAVNSYVHSANPNHPPAKANSSDLFENPLQPKKHTAPPQMNYLHPYPKVTLMKPASGGFHTIINSFKNQDGTLDMNKMIDTAGQMMAVMNQFSSVVKGFGSVFKQT
jgi:hypothetical protein